MVHLRRHALRRIGIVTVTSALVLGIAAFAAMSGQETKQGPVLIEGQGAATPAPPADEQPSGPALPAVPARATPPDAMRCDPGWSYFDDPVLHYTLCTPPGWGFSDFRSAQPMADIPGRELEDLHLLSPAAFPWQTGRFPFDAVRASGVFDIELDLQSADPSPGAECRPSLPIDVAGSTFLTCEQPYDADGLPASSGDLRALKALVPLRSSPADGDSAVDQPKLLMILRFRASASTKEVSALWQIVRSVRTY